MESIADEVLVGILEESTFGVDPGTARQLIRLTGESLATVPTNIQSQEITGDRQVVDLVRAGLSVAGDINYELSAAAFDLPFSLALARASGLGANGSSVRSLVIEREYTDQTTLSAVFRGCMVNTMSLNVTPGQIVTGSFGIIGKDEAAGTGMSVPTAAPTNDVLNAVDNVSALTEGGSAIDLLSLTLNLNNNLRPRPIIGQLGPKSVALGQLVVTGTLQAYFENATLYNKFLNKTGSALLIDVEDGAGLGYQFSLPSIEYTAGRRVAGGINTDIIVELEFQAIKHATGTILITTIAP